MGTGFFICSFPFLSLLFSRERLSHLSANLFFFSGEKVGWWGEFRRGGWRAIAAALPRRRRKLLPLYKFFALFVSCVLLYLISTLKLSNTNPKLLDLRFSHIIKENYLFTVLIWWWRAVPCCGSSLSVLRLCFPLCACCPVCILCLLCSPLFAVCRGSPSCVFSALCASFLQRKKKKKIVPVCSTVCVTACVCVCDVGRWCCENGLIEYVLEQMSWRFMCCEFRPPLCAVCRFTYSELLMLGFVKEARNLCCYFGREQENCS